MRLRQLEYILTLIVWVIVSILMYGGVIPPAR